MVRIGQPRSWQPLALPCAITGPVFGRPGALHLAFIVMLVPFPGAISGPGLGNQAASRALPVAPQDMGLACGLVKARITLFREISLGHARYFARKVGHFSNCYPVEKEFACLAGGARHSSLRRLFDAASRGYWCAATKAPSCRLFCIAGRRLFDGHSNDRARVLDGISMNYGSFEPPHERCKLLFWLLIKNSHDPKPRYALLRQMWCATQPP
jgi:hypothetical protein